MARDDRRTSLVFPILLITFGALFLYAQRHPEFDPWPLLRTWWPLLLVFIGLGKIWDYLQDRNVAAHIQAQRPEEAHGQTQAQAQSSSLGAQAAPPPRSSNVGATVGVLVCVLVIFLLLWHSGGRARARGFGGGMRHELRTVELQGAKSVRSVINMSAGDLIVSGESSHLLDASFDYRGNDHAPEVDYHVNGEQGDLNIDEPEIGNHVVFPRGTIRPGRCASERKRHSTWRSTWGREKGSCGCASCRSRD